MSTITEYNEGQPSGGGSFDTGVWGSGEDELEPTNACERFNFENLKLKANFQKTKFQGRLTEISSGIATATVEKSFSFGISTSISQLETVTPINVGYANGGSVTILGSYTTMKVYGAVHTHPKFSEYKAFSAADIFEFAKGNKQNPDFRYYIVKAYDGSVYGLVITDLAKLRNFFDNNSKIDFVNDENNFKITSDIGGDIENLIRFFKNNGKSKNEAYELALAFVLKKYNVGLGLSKMDANGDFKPLFVNEIMDPQNPKKKIHEPSTNCNLN